MFGSVVLDVAIGLIFVYLLVSLMVTSVTELTSGLLKSRAKNLWRGLHHLLDSGSVSTWVEKLYDHPLIDSLGTPSKPAAGKPAAKTSGQASRHGPSYIPSRTFAVALLEILREPQRAFQMEIDRIPDDASLTDVQKHLTDWAAALPEDTPWKAQAAQWIAKLPPSLSTAAAKKWLRSLSLQDLIDNLQDDPDSKLKKHLLALYDESRGDVEEFKKNTEIWFNNSMDRVSGWYKRRTQVFNFAAAAVLVIFLNVDSVLILHALSENPALREVLVSEAKTYTESENAPAAPAASAGDSVEQFQSLRAQIGALGLPIGWSMKPATDKNVGYRQFPGTNLDLWGSTLGFHLLGWVISMFAVSLGAPFWFDMLNKVVSIRSSGRAPEEKPKSPEKVPQPREPGNVPATDPNKVIVEVVHSAAAGTPAP